MSQPSKPVLVRLRARVLPYDTASAALPISLPVTLYSANFPNTVSVNIQSFWTNVSGDDRITVRFLGDDGADRAPAVELPLRKGGSEWLAGHVQQLSFPTPGGIDIVLRHGNDEVERRRIELRDGPGSPRRP